MRVQMIPHQARIGDGTWRFAVSDNADATTWAVNVHGYFAGGQMYWRESARLAAALDWRVITPSLPGFGGSDPLPPGRLSLDSLSDGLAQLLDHLGVDKAVVLGHSMGAAVAVRFATDYEDRTLGVVCRDGAATPDWKRRHGPAARLISPLNKEAGAVADLAAWGVLDLPDLAFGRLRSNVLGVLPDLQRNVRGLRTTLRMAALLRTCDLRAEVAALRVPALAVWGRFDRISPPSTAAEFAALAGLPIVWVAGGHSWMLARPNTQARVLLQHPDGRAFLDALSARQESAGP